MGELAFHGREAPIESSESGPHVVGLLHSPVVDRLPRPGPDVSRLPLPTDDQAGVLEERECPFHGADRHAVASRDLGMAGESLSGRKSAALHVLADGCGYLLVLRAWVVGVEFLHVDQATTAFLGGLAVPILPSMSMSSTLSSVALATSTTEKAPTNVAALAGAAHRTLGESNAG